MDRLKECIRPELIDFSVPILFYIFIAVFQIRLPLPVLPFNAHLLLQVL